MKLKNSTLKKLNSMNYKPALALGVEINFFKNLSKEMKIPDKINIDRKLII